MFMRSAAILAVFAPAVVFARRGGFGGAAVLAAGRFYSINSAAGARGLAPSAGEAKGLYRQALKPVALDAAGRASPRRLQSSELTKVS